MRTRSGIVSAIPLMLAAFAMGTVLVLGAEVRALRGTQRQVQRMKAFPHAGQWVPTIRVGTLTGDSMTMGETTPGRAQVLIAFSTTCPYCLATLPKWKALTDSLRKDGRFDVLWISASSWDSTRAYVAQHGITAAVVRMPTAKLARVYQIKAVPLTIVLDRWGRVEHAHASVFNTAAEMDSVFIAANRAAAADSISAAAAIPPRPARR